MAYDDPRYRGESAFLDEPQYRTIGGGDEGRAGGGADARSAYPASYDYGGAEYGGADYGGAEYGGAEYGGAEYVAPGPEPDRGHTTGRHGRHLGDVFDDPDHGEPGRDSMVVHLVLECALVAAVVAVAYLLRQSAPETLRGDGLKGLLLFASVIGLLAVGAGLSVRAAVPNLAIGPVAYACALYFAKNAGAGLTPTALVTAGIAVGAGLVLAALVVGLHVPSWAASLGMGLAAIAWIEQQGQIAQVPAGAYQPGPDAFYWFAGFAGLALIGGLLGLAKPIRRGLGRFRPVADPAYRRGGSAALVSTAALVGSMALAAVAGVVLALDRGGVDPSQNGIEFTGLAFGAALVGGTSAFGRRGGVLGTVLGVLLVVLVLRYAGAEQWSISDFAMGAAAIGVGLVVTRLVERFGRPPVAVGYEAPEPARDWTPTTSPPPDPTSTGENGWSSSRSGGWASPLPARTTDEGWGRTERWGR